MSVPPIELSYEIKTSKDAKSIINKLDEKESELLFQELSKRKNSENTSSVEKEKTSELEKKNYKIDKNMSVEEKIKNWWEQEKDVKAYIDGVEKEITVLKKDLWNDAFVREYMDDGVMPKEYVGQQKFNRAAVEKLWLANRLPKNYEEFRKIIWDDHNNFIKKYFSKNGKPLLSGCWSPHNKGFGSIGKRENCWLWDGDNVEVNKSHITHNNYNPRFGFSVRLLKSA